MSTIRSTYSHKRLLLAGLAAVVSTIATSATQGVIGLFLSLVHKRPEWLTLALLISIAISIAAITQAFAVLRRWQIGATVTTAGAFVFLILLFVTNPSEESYPNVENVRHFCLALSFGTMFGGAGWLFTAYLLRSYSTSSKQQAPVKPSNSLDPQESIKTTNPIPSIDYVYPTPDGNQKSSEPLNQTSGCYVIFLRIHGLTKKPIAETSESNLSSYHPLTTSQIFAAINILKTVTDGPYPTYSSPFGRFVMLPPVIKDTLALATHLLYATAALGVRVAIGITYDDRHQLTKDLNGENVTARGINQAARLAHLPGGAGKIAVDNSIQSWVEDTGIYKLSDKYQNKVKTTHLVFHWLSMQSPTVKALEATHRASEATKTIVVYDVAGFSEKSSIGLGETSYRLYVTAKSTLNLMSNEDYDQSKNTRPYAPGGDGGVVIFNNAFQAWFFAERLASNARVQNLQLRIGITTGQVVICDDNYPVGRGICEADELSGLGKPDTGCVCVSMSYWLRTLEGENPTPTVHKRGVKLTSQHTPDWTAVLNKKLEIVKLTRKYASQRPLLSQIFGKLTVPILMLISILFIVIAINKPIQSTDNSFEPYDVQALSKIYQNQWQIVRMYSYVLGLSPFGKTQVDDFFQNNDDLIRRISDPSIKRPPHQQAEITLITTLRDLYLETAIRHPEFTSPEDIKERLTHILRALEKLKSASEPIKTTKQYLLMLHLRFFAIQLADKVVTNVESDERIKASLGTSFPQISSQIEYVRENTYKEVRDAKYRDPLLHMDDMVSVVLTNARNIKNKPQIILDNPQIMVNMYKTNYLDISSMIDRLPFDGIAPNRDLELRLHIMRLQTFYFLVANSKPDEDLQVLYRSLTFKRDQGLQTELDISFQKLRDASKSETLDYVKVDWADTMLSNFITMRNTHASSCPWDVEKVDEMMRDQVNPSRDLIARLSSSDELSPEYLLSSIRLRLASLPYFIKVQDKIKIQSMIASCEEDLDRLIHNQKVLMTPIRTESQKSFTAEALSEELKILDQFKRDSIR